MFISYSKIIFIKRIRDALRDLGTFKQFKKREKHPGRSVTFSKACNFTKGNTPPCFFFTFFKFFKWSQIAYLAVILLPLTPSSLLEIF